MAGGPRCEHEHEAYTDSVCRACGQPCEHDVILNGVCYRCGATDLDGVAISPKSASEIIPASRLVRKPGD